MELVDEPEARVMVLGQSIEDGDALFVGPLEDAKIFVDTLPPEQRQGVAIVTDGRVYAPGEI